MSALLPVLDAAGKPSMLEVPALPTFSGLPRWFACELTDVLPVAKTGPTAASLAGDARHGFFRRIADLLQHGLPREEGAPTPVDLEAAVTLAISEAPEEEREALEALPLEAIERLDLGTVAPEVALAYDLATGECRELGRDLGREYDAAGRRPTEIVGATDRLSFIGADGLHVGDYKGRSHRTDPDEDEQFLAAALVASRVHQRSFAEIEVFPVVDGWIYHRRATVDRLALDTFEYRLQDRAALMARNVTRFRATGELPPASLGEHCTYCDRAAYCPARWAIARSVLGQQDTEIAAFVKTGQILITDENAARLWDLTSQAEKMLKALRSALKDHARVYPFPLPNGKVVGVNPDATETEFVDGEKAAAALAELFGPAAPKARKVTVTWTAIEEATRALKGADLARGDLKEYREKATALLLERGLLRVVKGGTVEAYKPKTGKGK